jgi:hypothetical protein
MDEFQASQDLVNEVLRMLIRQFLRGADDPFQVTLEQLCHYVQCMEILCLRWPSHDIHDFDYVVMVTKVTQQLDLSQYSFRVNKILEHAGNTLDCDLQTQRSCSAFSMRAARADLETRNERDRPNTAYDLNMQQQAHDEVHRLM